MRVIYLYKPPETENMTSTWVYYRAGSIAGPDTEAGTELAPIQMARVSWPTFEDIHPVTDTPGITGLASAWEQMCQIAKSQWDVNHTTSECIGILEDPGDTE